MKHALIAKVEPELTCREEFQHAAANSCAIPSLPPVCKKYVPGGANLASKLDADCQSVYLHCQSTILSVTLLFKPNVTQ